MLLDKLNKVRASKTDLFTLQKRFYAELLKRFPFIMNADMAKMANKLEDELQSLLCCSLKFNSIKIPLPATNNYSNTTKVIANVQRSQPGFYYPQSQRGKSDIHYMDTENYLKDNGDMWRKYDERSYDMNSKVTLTKKDVLKVGLSELKNPKYAKQIIPEKLDAYFKLSREVMAYRPNFLCYTEEGYDNNKGREFKVPGLEFRMLEKSLNIQFTGKVDKESHHGYRSSHGFRYQPDHDDLHRLLDYSDPGSKTFGTSVHQRMKLFIKNYAEIRTKLDSEEARKKKAYQTCQGFLKQIRVYTLPFKVLGELHK